VFGVRDDGADCSSKPKWDPLALLPMKTSSVVLHQHYSFLLAKTLLRIDS
jgi:hypothetical protein